MLHDKNIIQNIIRTNSNINVPRWTLPGWRLFFFFFALISKHFHCIKMAARLTVCIFFFFFIVSASKVWTALTFFFFSLSARHSSDRTWKKKKKRNLRWMHYLVHVAPCQLRGGKVYTQGLMHLWFHCGEGLSVACLIITHLSTLNVCASAKPAGHTGLHTHAFRQAHAHARTHSEGARRAFLFLFTASSIIHPIRLSLHAHEIRHIHARVSQ